MTQVAGLDLPGVVAAGLQLGNTGPVDLESDRRHPGAPKSNCDRQADIAETDDCDASPVHFPVLVTSPATLILKPRDRKWPLPATRAAPTPLCAVDPRTAKCNIPREDHGRLRGKPEQDRGAVT